MAVTKNVYGQWLTLRGTLAEVAGALNSEGFPAHKVVAVFYDGTAYVAVCHRG